MKVVILAGGYGTRLSEETGIVPKPLVEMGGKPILHHIMKIYAAHGLTEFVICCGYKGVLIKRYFRDMFFDNSDFTIDLAANKIETHRSELEPWRVTLVDTGLDTMTGGRLKRVRDYLGNQTFCLTYGDGVGNIDITRSIAFHREQGVLATVTGVRQPGRFGAMNVDPGTKHVSGFREKSAADGLLINGGFFVLEPQVIDFIDGDDTVFENDPMDRLIAARQFAMYEHRGYWQNMDTLRDRQVLQKLCEQGSPPWFEHAQTISPSVQPEISRTSEKAAVKSSIRIVR